MRKLLLSALVLAVVAFTTPAFANGNDNGHENGNGHNGGNGGQGGQGGGGGSVHHNTTTTQTTKVKAKANAANTTTVNVAGSGRDKSPASAPAVTPPSLAAIGAENCMGSVSLGLGGSNGLVGAGLGFGKTTESRECNRRANAKYLILLAQMTGDDTLLVTAVNLILQNEDVRKAAEVSGLVAPLKDKAATTTSSGGGTNDGGPMAHVR